MSFSYLMFCILLVEVTSFTTVTTVTTVRDKWIDPISNTSLTLSSNATGLLRVGDVISYTCTAAELSNPTANVQWADVIGDYKIDVLKDSSPVVLTKVIEASDNGKELQCHSQFFNQHGIWPYYYNVYSEKLMLSVSGVSTTATKPIFTMGQSLTITSNATTTNHKVSDVVQYECQMFNIQATFLEVRQVKGPYELKVNVGYQQTRTLTWTLDLSDDGTSIYCIVYTMDSRWNIYTIESERIPINVS